MLKYDFYRGWYWPSKDTIANVVHLDLDLYFQGHEISGNYIVYNILKTMRAKKAENIQPLLLPSDRKSCICHLMAPLQMLYIVTMTYIFKVTKFEMLIFWKWRELSKYAQVWLLYKLIFTIEWDHCDWCIPWPWPSLSMSNIFLLCICHKRNLHRKRISSPDLPRLAWNSPWSCSCLINY